MWKALLCLVCLTGTAAARDAVATYALVVGSNAGGPGQTALRYAEDDARRVGRVLVELGGYPRDQVDVVLHPTPDALRARIDALAARLAADAAAGRTSRVFFYYSGHARATAIDLGAAALPLPELRRRLFALPATLTVVVLDACQSGAFSRVKGARPAADFSFNSRQQLDATGVAVLASSSGSELSQESEQLGGSYFTHHLLVGLRGAGDVNRDGLVTIDEAYRYAYHQTLLATAETAVGGQHVSLEVDLKGHGEVPLSYPRAATAHIELPPALEGKTLVEDERAHVVVAETYKAKGAAVRIAVAPGAYRVLVRDGATLSRCEVGADGVVDLARCDRRPIAAATAKGGATERRDRNAYQFLIGGERDDAFTRTLESVGFARDPDAKAWGSSIGFLHRIHDHLWVGGEVAAARAPTWKRDGMDDMTLSWETVAVSGVGRAEVALGKTGVARWIKGYAQLGLGVGLGRLRSDDDLGDAGAGGGVYVGPALSLGAGVMIGGEDRLLWLDGLGLAVGYQFDYAPVIENVLGETHASGGHRALVSVSFSY